MQGRDELLHRVAILVIRTRHEQVGVRRAGILDEQCITRRHQLGFERVVGVDQRQIELIEEARQRRGFQFLDLEALRILGDVLDRRQDVLRVLEFDQTVLFEQDQCAPAVGRIVRDGNLCAVRNVFDAYVAELEKEFRRETPIWLGIDEIKLGRFRAIFTNIQGRTLVDMLPERYYTSIVRFLESLPNKEQIEIVATDMWRPYRLAVLRVLPHAKLVVDKFHVVSKANASLDAVRRSIGKADQKKQGAGLKKAHKLFAKRAADLDDEQYLTVSGWLNCFPLLATAYDLKERLYKVYEVETKEEAWAEYLNWEASIPPELAKPFKPVNTAFRNWREYILNYFDDNRVTNAFTESFNSKVRRVYRDGRGYTFERLRAKVLYTDRLQKRVPIQEKVKTKKKQRFEEVAMARYMCLMGSFDDDYEMVTKTRQGNLGTDLSTLDAILDSGQF